MKKYLMLVILLFTSSVFAKEIDYFSCPVPIQYRDKISSTQGLRDPLSEEEAGVSTSGMWHNGIDYIVPDKTPVFAAKDGIVTCVYPSYYNGSKWKGDRVYGGLIVIKHYDGTITMYAHLSLTKVKTGDVVSREQTIGWSGGVKGRRGSGASTGDHLHFSIYLDMKDFIK